MTVYRPRHCATCRHVIGRSLRCTREPGHSPGHVGEHGSWVPDKHGVES